jgi:kumamolisin
LPPYQANANVPVSINPPHFKGRGVPDVSGDADPATGYEIRVDGRNVVFGGTSAVAPLWAALIALINQQLNKPVGFLNAALYGAVAQKAFHDITQETMEFTLPDPGGMPALVWEALTGSNCSPRRAACPRPPDRADGKHTCQGVWKRCIAKLPG